MDVFTMVVIIVVASLVYAAYEVRVKAKAKSGNITANAAEFTSMRDEIARLKERVRVLETIVTDKDHALAEEFRKLA